MNYEIVDTVVDKNGNEIVLDEETLCRLMDIHSSTPRIVYSIYDDETRQEELREYQAKQLLL